MTQSVVWRLIERIT